MSKKRYKALIDQRLWEYAQEDNAKVVRDLLESGAGFTHRLATEGVGDALMVAISSRSESVIPILLRAHPSPHFSAVNAAISNSTLSDAIVMKVVKHFDDQLGEKHKGQLPLHAALGRNTSVVAKFLLSKRKVKEAAGATYKGLNALEILMSRPEILGHEWRRVIRTLIDLGQSVRSKTPINALNRALLE